MFYKNESFEFQQKYIDSLCIVGSLSNLFSDSKVPYLYYRIAEKIFCSSFNANDLSRGDIALDASKSKFKDGSDLSDTVYLPLYGKDKKVSEKSSLNQWNASGRERHPNEIYIPIPAKVHRYSPNFFPQRDKPFNLHLPNGGVLNVKVCQDNSKALMSNPNKALGKWLLRDVLGLKEGELLTYEKLQIIGIDSIRLDKIDNENFKINFVSSGSFEEYLTLYED
ncbi:NgoFVII family restriction endonuclease [bacterium]|nr:NgoFVII family restriction endonuclease [bacterium]MBU1958854.1 NgoFVII family restriction endonuclease [bacterium]